MAERNNVDLSSDPRAIIGSRVFHAPRDLVFAAWTDAKHLSQWWGPDGFTTTTSHFDMRPGGQWRFVMHGPDGRDYENRITFEEILRPERIAYSHGGGGDVEPVTFKSVVTFEDIGGGKTRITLKGTFPTQAERARVIAEYGADKGMVQTLSRLGQYVETQMQPEPVFTMSRVFDAPRDLVWAAWTEPKHLVHWWGPKGFTVVKCDVNLTPGGLFHYALQAANGYTMWGKLIYREIVKPEKLTVVVAFSDEAGGETRHPLSPTWPLTTLSVMTLEEEGGKTKLTVHWSPLNPTETERATFAAGMDGMKQGTTGTMDQLAAYLAQIQSSDRHPKAQENSMTSLNVYLHFDGHCAEAFALYEKVFHVKAPMTMTYGDAPGNNPTPPNMKNKIMHTRIQVGNSLLMGSDAPADRFHKPQGFAVSFNAETPQEADRVYKALSEGGQIMMAIQETFWAHRFAMFTDKFGTPWMVNCEKRT
uniref:Uncharacterized protein n=1 Tax=uncultured bacterium BLR9 TaxID=506525 RepID=C0INC7_9BACT|nr:hypothetical protein AKSOIL_0168 [uncultured bacterium BLR9]